MARIGGELSRSSKLSTGKEEIQMDDRKWWTEADKGRRAQVGRISRVTRGGFAARAEEWTSLFSRLWWKRFSRIAVSR